MTATTPSPSKETFPHWIYDEKPIEDPLGYGERAVAFLRKLKHPKSTLPRKQFQLDAWQERIVRRIYGPRDPNGNRTVNTVVILVPRGNRKTSLSAAIALLHTIGPELASGGEVIFAASDRKQAGIAFKEARSIVQADKKHLVPATKVYDAFNSAKKIAYPKEGVELEVVSSDAPSQEGRTPTFVLADEIHVWRGDGLWKVLTNGLDKIDNSLLVIATTAGRGQDNVAFEVIERARKIARGEIVDPSWLPVLFESPPDVDYSDEDAWKRVNPGSAHGYPSLQGFRRHVARAKNSPGERASLLQYKLNVWQDHSTSPFVDTLHIHYLHLALQKLGPVHGFSLRLDDPVEAQAALQPDALGWLSRRIARRLQDALGYLVQCYCVLEQDDCRKLHVHGEMGIVDHNGPTVKRDRAKARKALRLAGGEFPKIRQFQAHVPRDAPDSGWSGYLAKDFVFFGPIVRPWLISIGSNYAPGFNGDQISRTKVLGALAESIYNEHRALVMRAA